MPPQIETTSIIHSENLNRSTPGRTQSLNVRSPESKVTIPCVAPGMEQALDIASYRVDAREIGTFVKIAAMASEREIAGIIETAMLLCNDMLDVMEQFSMPLVELAILATLPGPLTDESPRTGIHLLTGDGFQMPSSFELQDRDKIRCVNQGFILSPLVSVKSTFVGQLTKMIDALLYRRVHTKLDETS